MLVLLHRSLLSSASHFFVSVSSIRCLFPLFPLSSLMLNTGTALLRLCIMFAIHTIQAIQRIHTHTRNDTNATDETHDTNDTTNANGTKDTNDAKPYNWYKQHNRSCVTWRGILMQTVQKIQTMQNHTTYKHNTTGIVLREKEYSQDVGCSFCHKYKKCVICIIA